MCQIGWTPCERGDPLIMRLPFGAMDLVVVPERRIVNLVQEIDIQHQALRRIPCIHQHGMKRQLHVMEDPDKHVLHKIELGLAVLPGIANALIDHAAPACLEIGIHGVDQTNAFDEFEDIAAELPRYQFDFVRDNLVQHSIVPHCRWCKHS